MSQREKFPSLNVHHEIFRDMNRPQTKDVSCLERFMPRASHVEDILILDVLTKVKQSLEYIKLLNILRND